MASYKALAIARRLADEVARRTALTVTESFDASGNPLLTVGTITAAGKGALIRVVNESTIQKNSLGLDQEVFTPHIVQLMLEANFAGTTDNVADYVTTLEKAQLVAECVSTGCAVEIWETANGTPVSESAFGTSSNKKGSLAPDLQYPLMNQQ